MSHTQCKLTVSESCIYANEYHLMANGNWLMAIQHNGEQLAETQRENARRLVACWNACEGIDTDVLEKGRVSPDAFRLEESRADQAERRCDRLLAALQGVVRVADRKTEEFDAARAAIAAAEIDSNTPNTNKG